jgi:Fic family protein
LLCKICGIILDKEITVRKIPGTHLRDAATNEIFYTPPEGEAVIRDKLSNLETFLHNNHTIDPLIKASIIHYQFEAIHPFHDGNGRTGRILLLLYLISQGLLHTPVLYLSRYILEHKSDYYRLIRNITEQNEWETWIIFMLTAIQETAIQTTKKILDIKELLDQTCRRGRSELSGGVYSKELIETTFVQPYCKIKFLQDNKIAERRTASKYLQALVDKGFLERITVGRDILYINSNLIEILKK